MGIWIYRKKLTEEMISANNQSYSDQVVNKK